MDKSIHGRCGLTSRSYLQAVAKPINSSHEYFSTPETSQVTTGILSIRQKHDNTRAEAVLALPHERFSCQLLCYCLGVLYVDFKRSTLPGSPAERLNVEDKGELVGRRRRHRPRSEVPTILRPSPKNVLHVAVAVVVNGSAHGRGDLQKGRFAHGAVATGIWRQGSSAAASSRRYSRGRRLRIDRALDAGRAGWVGWQWIKLPCSQTKGVINWLDRTDENNSEGTTGKYSVVLPNHHNTAH
jgi:hypothetical protein